MRDESSVRIVLGMGGQESRCGRVWCAVPALVSPLPPVPSRQPVPACLGHTPQRMLHWGDSHVYQLSYHVYQLFVFKVEIISRIRAERPNPSFKYRTCKATAIARKLCFKEAHTLISRAKKHCRLCGKGWQIRWPLIGGLCCPMSVGLVAGDRHTHSEGRMASEPGMAAWKPGAALAFCFSGLGHIPAL